MTDDAGRSVTGEPTGGGDHEAAAADVTVLSGRPTDEELAAVVAVLAARRGVPAGPEPGRDSSAWSAPSRRFRPPMYPGGDGWWRSGNPR